MFQGGGLRGTACGLKGDSVRLPAPVQADQSSEFSGFIVDHCRMFWMFWCSQSQAAGRIVRGMKCRHLSMHGCNFESDRRRKVGSGSLNAKERYIRIGGRTQGNTHWCGGEVVHRLWLGLEGKAPVPAGEQLRKTYTTSGFSGSQP
jgi:hypothetical protein